MNQFDTYSRYAYLYPAWTAMILPFFLLYSYLSGLGVDFFKEWTDFTEFIKQFVPLAIAYAAIGFFFTELFRNTSKMIFQFPLFKEDETQIPTTQFLLWSTSYISKEQKHRIRAKVYSDFNHKMPTAEDEALDINDVMQNIVDAVSKMRNVTRSDKVLLQHNYRFGFCRNLLGGLVWAIIVTVIILIINRLNPVMSDIYFKIGILVEFLIGLLAFFCLKYLSRSYARNLFNVYLVTMVKE